MEGTRQPGIISERDIEGFLIASSITVEESTKQKFLSLIDIAAAEFIISHLGAYNTSQNRKDNRDKSLKFYNEIDKNSTNLISLLIQGSEQFWESNSEEFLLKRFKDFAPNLPEKFFSNECTKELEKSLSKEDSRVLTVGYATDTQNLEVNKLIYQLLTIKMTALSYKKNLSKIKQGRHKSLGHLNIFALKYARSFKCVLNQKFTLYRHKSDNNNYDPITPAHILFTEIINKIHFCLGDAKVSQANIINSLEYYIEYELGVSDDLMDGT